MPTKALQTWLSAFPMRHEKGAELGPTPPSVLKSMAMFVVDLNQSNKAPFVVRTKSFEYKPCVCVFVFMLVLVYVFLFVVEVVLVQNLLVHSACACACAYVFVVVVVFVFMLDSGYCWRSPLTSK